MTRKGVAPFPTTWYSSYWKGSLQVALFQWHLHEMETALSKIWTWVADTIFYDGNCYAKCLEDVSNHTDFKLQNFKRKEKNY